MEQRAEPRVSHNIRFFVHVQQCDEDHDMVGVSVECEAIDFSKRGMQFSCDTVLPSGTILNITIGIGEPFAMFLLHGEVRWVRQNESEIFMGVLLEDDESTDYVKWETDFDLIFAADDELADDQDE